jgi:16S rRNA (guanine527-N7)-methyltransferase
VKHIASNPSEIGVQVARKLRQHLAGTELIEYGTQFLSQIEAFASLLADWGQKINLTANHANPDVMAFHVIDSLAPLIVDEARIALGLPNNRILKLIDIGSGAGFPGLILAAATGAETILFEARRKRASFLQVAAGAMNLPRVTVIHARADADNVPSGFGLVTTRAVGGQRAFLALAGSKLAPGGTAIIYLSQAQEPRLNLSAPSGLAMLPATRYSIPRATGPVERILGLWRKTNRD